MQNNVARAFKSMIRSEELATETRRNEGEMGRMIIGECMSEWD